MKQPRNTLFLILLVLSFLTLSFKKQSPPTGAGQTMILTMNKGGSKTYMLKIKNKNGKSFILLEDVPMRPIVTWLKDGIVRAILSCGSLCSNVSYFDSITGKEEVVFNPIAYDEDKKLIVYINETSEIVVKKLFSKKSQKIKLNFSPTAVARSAVKSCEFKDPDKLELVYMQGPDFVKTHKLINLNL